MNILKSGTFITRETTGHHSHDLKRQLIGRFAAVFLLATLIGAFAALTAYRISVSKSQRQSTDIGAEHIQRHLNETCGMLVNF